MLKNLCFHLLEPGLEKSGLPEPRQVIGGIGALEVLVRVILRGRFGRAERRRRGGPELTGSGEYSRVPCSISGLTGVALLQVPVAGAKSHVNVWLEPSE